MKNLFYGWYNQTKSIQENPNDKPMRIKHDILDKICKNINFNNIYTPTCDIREIRGPIGKVRSDVKSEIIIKIEEEPF